MQIVKDLNKIDIHKLELFVNNHPNANFFQSTEALNLYRIVDNYSPILLVAEVNEEYFGSLLGVVIQEGAGIKGFLSKRLIIYGGPIVKNNDPEVARFLLSELKNYASKNAIYSQFRNLFNTNVFRKIFSDLKWEYDAHLDIVVNLKKSEEELWKDVNSKRRNEIRRAEKEGTRFHLLNNKQDLAETYNILQEVYGRAKLPLPEYKFFEAAYDTLYSVYFKIFIATNNDKIIGTMYVLCYNDIVYDWYAGSYKKYYNKYPNDLIPWRVILWGKANGYRKFDFGGAGKPGVSYGVRDYKKKFGGEMVNYGRYEKIHKPFLYKIAKVGFKIYQILQ